MNNKSYLKETKEILNNINGYKLDIYQREVVLSEHDSSLVIAGAGSGKSLTIIGKIIYLVKIKKIDPKDILCISFTNEATNSLKEKLLTNYNLKIDIYTFHKLALTILKDNNIDYQIAPSTLLEDTIDEFFNMELNNKKLKKVLKRVSKEELNSLKKLIHTFISLFKSNNYEINDFLNILKRIKHTFSIKEYLNNKRLLLMIINIYILYEYKLKSEKALDFNDMINKAIKVLNNRCNLSEWQYIIIDEYQDTSMTKLNMLKEIKRITNAKLLAVGDDFQSIYRFTGCDLHIFLNFQFYFPNSQIFHIINTYRNPQELINVAGAFIMKNKYQQKKRLISAKHIEKPIIIYYDNNKKRALKEVLKIIQTNKILVLGRNNKDINKYIDDTYTIKDNIYSYNNINFKYLTIHKSKGLESDNVILINVEDDTIGMPSKLKDEKILKYVNNTKDYYPYEEERRLFYVALTRTKNCVYIISSYKHESIFTKEIKKYKKYVDIIKK